MHFGTGALSLDLEPGRGLTDAIENPSRIDGLFIERAMVKASDMLAVLSAEAPINAPVITDGAAFYQLQEEMRGAFECTVVDLPRSMLVNHPHLVSGVQVAVVVTDFTLAAARDTIRILAWFKSNAPACRVILVANRVQAAGALEISRKDFESSIERKIDFAIPFDPKVASQAAKLGKSLAEAAKSNKAFAALPELAQQLAASAEGDMPAASSGKVGKAKAPGTGRTGESLLGKLGVIGAKLAPSKKTK